MGDLDSPEGIERRHVHEAGGSRLQTWPFGLIGLGVLLGASLLGWFGTEERLTDTAGPVTLEVHGPSRIRNGEFFELILTVRAAAAVEDLVLLVDEDAWRDVTINTFIPAPAEEGMRDGAFEFSFGPLEAGSSLVVKVDGQVNPDHSPSANRGEIAVADGAGDPLAAVDYVMEVLP